MGGDGGGEEFLDKHLCAFLNLNNTENILLEILKMEHSMSHLAVFALLSWTSNFPKQL